MRLKHRRAAFRTIIGLGYAPYPDRWPDCRRLQLARARRRAGLLRVRPAGVRAAYGPVSVPGARDARQTRRRSGFDMMAEPVRAAAMRAARDGGQTRISGRCNSNGMSREPVPEPGDVRAGVPLRHAVPRSLARKAALQGWVYAPLHIPALVDASLRRSRPNIAIARSATSTRRTRCCTDRPSRCRAGRAAQAFTRTRGSAVYGRRWRPRFQPDADADRRDPQPRSSGRRSVAGRDRSLLLFGVALVLARTESRARQIAARLSESYRRSELRFRNAMGYSAIGKALLDARAAMVEANPALADDRRTSRRRRWWASFGAQFEDAPRDPPQRANGHAVAKGVYRDHAATARAATANRAMRS